MNQEDETERLEVRLHVDNEVDYLEFNLGGKVHKLNLNLEDNQTEIKKMFCDLIPILKTGSIEFSLVVDDGYDSMLLKEVSESYVNDLNQELRIVRTEILDKGESSGE